MKVETKKLDKLKRTIRVKVSGDEFIQENLPSLDDLSVSVHMIKGRKGIAP